MLHLAASTNGEGYFSALHNTWRKCGGCLQDTPAKSSLSEFRDKVSFEFFREVFQESLKQLEPMRRKFRGFHIYAIDGDSLDLPASADVLKNKYRGYPTSRGRETHFPKMYAVHCLDVINGSIREFGYSETQAEVHIARQMVSRLEENSITLYDRLHCGYGVIFAHTEANNYFVVRARTSGPGIKSEIREFRDTSKRSDIMLWHAMHLRRQYPGLAVRLVKVKNPRSGEDLIFVTNLSKDQFSDLEIAKLYLRRWDIEGSFRDLTTTLKMHQWHSKKLNGILQEIFALLWLTNAVRAECNRYIKHAKNWFCDRYEKSNFKLCTEIVIENLDLLIFKKRTEFYRILEYWIRRSTEKRRRLSRSYPRVVKQRGREYTQANVVPRR